MCRVLSLAVAESLQTICLPTPAASSPRSRPLALPAGREDCEISLEVPRLRLQLLPARSFCSVPAGTRCRCCGLPRRPSQRGAFTASAAAQLAQLRRLRRLRRRPLPPAPAAFPLVAPVTAPDPFAAAFASVSAALAACLAIF